LILQNGRLHTYPWHHKRDYFQLSVGRDVVTLQARGHIGVIPINEWLTLEVKPRVPLGNLSRLLEVSGVQAKSLADVVRSYDVAGEMYPSLAVVYASGLRSMIETITARGLYRDYQQREELTSFPHGRIDMNRTLAEAHARGMWHRAAISHFRRSADNALNRCLLHAIWRLYYYLDQVADTLSHAERRKAQRDLNYCRLQFQGVELDWNEAFLTDPLVTGGSPLPTLRAYYRPALDLALAIIGRQALAVEQRGSHVELPTLLINMSDVFEAYAREVLRRAAIKHDWPYRVLDGNKQPPVGAASTLFDRESDTKVNVTPDTVLRHRQTSDIQAILEVKYRPAKPKPERNDLNQAITYGVSYRADSVVVLQPRGTFVPPTNPQLLGRIGSMHVYRYVMDLGSQDLLATESSFAAAMHHLAGGT